MDSNAALNQIYIPLAILLGIVVSHLILLIVKRRRKTSNFDTFKAWGAAAHIWLITVLLVIGVSLWQGFYNLSGDFARVEATLNDSTDKPKLPSTEKFDVVLLGGSEVNFVEQHWLKTDDLRYLMSGSTLMDSILILRWDMIGVYHQAQLISGQQLLTYYPVGRILLDSVLNSWIILLWATIIVFAFISIYTRKLARVDRSLIALQEVVVLEEDPSNGPEKWLYKSEITSPVVTEVLRSKQRSDRYLKSYQKLLGLEKPMVSAITKEVAGKWLFSPLEPINATSLRFIFPPSTKSKEKQHESISSLGTKDPYDEFDPLILSISNRTDRLILRDTSQLLKNGLKTQAKLPRSIFVINMVADGRKFGILWGGFDEPREFDPDEIELIDACANNLMSMLSENKQYEQEVKTVDRFRSVLNWTPLPIFTVDSSGRIDFANQSAVYLLGVDPTGKSGRDIPLIAKNTTLRQLMNDPSRVEMSAEIRMGEDQIYQCSISSLNVEGDVIGRVFTLLNITEIRALEKQQSEFVNTVSHDLRQPLTLIRGYANMLEMVGALNSTQLDYLKKISEGVDNMSQMVNSLLDLGRVEAGIGLQIEIVSMRDLLEKITRSFQLLAAQKQIAFEVDFVEADIMVQADWSLLKQALSNVIENAIKYSNPGGQVSLSITKVDEEMEMVVSDSGIGISADEQKHLFERFYRAKNELARSRKGTGLGLSIVKSIIDKHNGEIVVESQPGKGTKFIMTLPLRHE